MKNQRSVSDWIYKCLFLVITALLLGYAIVMATLIYTDVHDSTRNFSHNWIVNHGDYGEINTRIGNENESMVLEKVLPGTLTDSDSLCFASRNAAFTVWVNEREIYRFDPEENLTGVGYGTAYHAVPLRPMDGGLTVRIEVRKILEGYGGSRILNAYLSPTEDFLHMNIMKKFVPAMLCGIVAFLGMIMIFFYVRVPDKEHMPFDILSMGITAILVGFWLLTDTNILQLITGRLYIWRILNRSVILLVGYPTVCFFNSLTKLKRPVYQHVAFWTSVGALAIPFLLKAFAGVDMIVSFSPTVDVVVGLLVIFIVVIFVDNLRYCRANGLVAGIKDFYPGILIVIGCAVADVIFYALGIYHTDSYGVFTRLGMTIFVVLTLRQLFGWWTRDGADIARERFINRALQFAMASDSSDDSIRALLDYMGTELGAGRICVFEDRGNGKYSGTYEWFAEGRSSAGIDLVYLPYEGLIDDMYKAYYANNKQLIVQDPEDYRAVRPVFYNLMMASNVQNAVAAPLEANGKLFGCLVIIDVEKGAEEKAAKITELLSYFLSQLVLQREEQKRLKNYSYNDSLSGALNRRAFMEYIEGGLDKASAFGYLMCCIDGLEATNSTKGFEAGDHLVIEMGRCLMDVFGKENVYRLGGAEFVAFGFEFDETFFEGDVERVKKLCEEKGFTISTGGVFCSYGTMDMNRVLKRANDQMRREKAMK